MVDSVKRNGPYAPLSANYAEDDAITLLDLDGDSTAELLYVRALAYSARDLSTEGFISDVAIRAGRVLRRKKGVVEKAAERLVEVGLWDRENDGYRVRSWLKWNKSWDVLTRKRQADAERKAAGRAADSTGTDEAVHAESTRTDDGHDAESTTRPQGVAPPEALHVTTHHDTTGSSADAAPPKKSRKKPATAAPDLFPLTPEMRTWGQQNAPLVDNPKRETDQFLDWHRANDVKRSNWTQAWQVWMRRAQKDAEQRAPRIDPAANPHHEWMGNNR